MHHTTWGFSRRRVVISLGGLGLAATWPRAWAQTRLEPTPSVAEGPFYPLEWPKDDDADLLTFAGASGAKGEALALTGRIVNVRGEPVTGATIEIWQCDGNGTYHHPNDSGERDARFQGAGRTRTSTDGGYAFRTIRPVTYSGRTPHIHYTVKLGNRRVLTSQIFIAGEAQNARDFLYRGLGASQKLATAELARDGVGWKGEFQIVLGT